MKTISIDIWIEPLCVSCACSDSNNAYEMFLQQCISKVFFGKRSEIFVTFMIQKSHPLEC